MDNNQRLENNSPRRVAQTQLQNPKDLGKGGIVKGGAENMLDVFGLGWCTLERSARACDDDDQESNKP